MLAYPLNQIPYVIMTLCIAFSVHEFAHAYTAFKFGDRTAQKEGRLTLSPLAHVDLFGLLFLFIAGFGWAKPVPINPRNFKHPRLHSILVSIAGPISNLLLAALGLILWAVINRFGLIGSVPDWFSTGFYDFFSIYFRINLMLFAFNLLPFPPLDGYRIIEQVVAPPIRIKMREWESYGGFLFLVLIFVPPLGNATIYPYLRAVTEFTASMLQTILSPILG